jgi:hypothetical protein
MEFAGIIVAVVTFTSMCIAVGVWVSFMNKPKTLKHEAFTNPQPDKLRPILVSAVIFVPNSVKPIDVREYAQDALSHWGGSLFPGDIVVNEPGDVMFGQHKVTNVSAIEVRDK